MCAEPVTAMQPDAHKPKWREAVRERWRTTLLYVWERNGTPHPYAALPHTARRKVLSLIHLSEPTRLRRISYAVFCLNNKLYANLNIIETSHVFA